RHHRCRGRICPRRPRLRARSAGPPGGARAGRIRLRRSGGHQGPSDRGASGPARLCTARGGDPPRSIGAALTIALTGGTGFVGWAVVDLARRRGLPLKALARREQAPCEGVEWIRGDLADRAALARLVEGAEAVLHVAGVVNAPDPTGFHLG